MDGGLFCFWVGCLDEEEDEVEGVEGRVAEEGGKDGAGAKGEEAKAPTNEKNRVEVTIDAMSKGKEKGAREKSYARGKGAQEDATIEEFFS